jgi:hypothetical protein
MAVNEDIKAARRFGVVRCGISRQPSPSLWELAQEFNLYYSPDSYREIDEEFARTTVMQLLSCDMAYDAQIMPRSQAEELTHRFFAQFDIGTRYFTNNWCPVTGATFDHGILAINPNVSGCFWVEDED